MAIFSAGKSANLIPKHLIRVFFGIRAAHAPKKGAYIQASDPWVYTRGRKLLERLYRHSEVLGENP